MMRWIPVTERLPEINTEVLITVRVSPTNLLVTRSGYQIDDYDGQPKFADWDGGCPDYDFEETYYTDEVIAWMPMIEPYIPEEGE